MEKNSEFSQIIINILKLKVINGKFLSFFAFIFLVSSGLFAAFETFPERPLGERYGLEFEVTPPEFVGMIHLFDLEGFKKNILKYHGQEDLIKVLGESFFDKVITSEEVLNFFTPELKMILTKGLETSSNEKITLLNGHGQKIESDKVSSKIIILELNKPSTEIQLNNSHLVKNIKLESSISNSKVQDLELESKNGMIRAKTENRLQVIQNRWQKLSALEKFDSISWEALNSNLKTKLLFTLVETYYPYDKEYINQDLPLKPLNGITSTRFKELHFMLSHMDYHKEGDSIEFHYKDSYIVQDPRVLYDDIVRFASLTGVTKAILYPKEDLQRGSMHYHISRNTEVSKLQLDLMEDYQLLLRLQLGLTAAIEKVSEHNSTYGYAGGRNYLRGLVAYGKGDTRRIESRQHIMDLDTELKWNLHLMSISDEKAISELRIKNNLLLKNSILELISEKLEPTLFVDFLTRNEVMKNSNFNMGVIAEIINKIEPYQADKLVEQILIKNLKQSMSVDHLFELESKLTNFKLFLRDVKSPLLTLENDLSLAEKNQFKNKLLKQTIFIDDDFKIIFLIWCYDSMSTGEKLALFNGIAQSSNWPRELTLQARWLLLKGLGDEDKLVTESVLDLLKLRSQPVGFIPKRTPNYLKSIQDWSRLVLNLKFENLNVNHLLAFGSVDAGLEFININNQLSLGLFISSNENLRIKNIFVSSTQWKDSLAEWIYRVIPHIKDGEYSKGVSSIVRYFLSQRQQTWELDVLLKQLIQHRSTEQIKIIDDISFLINLETSKDKFKIIKSYFLNSDLLVRKGILFWALNVENSDSTFRSSIKIALTEAVKLGFYTEQVFKDFIQTYKINEIQSQALLDFIDQHKSVDADSEFKNNIFKVGSCSMIFN